MPGLNARCSSFIGFPRLESLTCHSSRKYYYVQLSTGQSTWDLPTEAAPGVPTPDATPSNTTGPYPPPGAGGERGMEGEGSERGLGVCYYSHSVFFCISKTYPRAPP